MLENIYNFISILNLFYILITCIVNYYLNNFFNVMGKTEKISLITSIWVPLVILTFLSSILLYNVNEK